MLKHTNNYVSSVRPIKGDCKGDETNLYYMGCKNNGKTYFVCDPMGYKTKEQACKNATNECGDSFEDAISCSDQQTIEGGNTAGGNTAGGNTDEGNTAGGNTAGGNTAGGNTAGGNTDEGKNSNNIYYLLGGLGGVVFIVVCFYILGKMKKKNWTDSELDLYFPTPTYNSKI